MSEPPEFLQEGRVFLVDKPLHWTSFDLVNKIRYAIKKSYQLKKAKVGHAGTLDPLATGLMLICVGKATKKAQELTGHEKVYSGTFELGATTPSYDLETEIDARFSVDGFTAEQVQMAAKTFEGEYDQMPPIFSAKKVEGKRAYELARQGEKPQLNTKRISITYFKVEEIEFPNFTFTVKCSSGTYIRSLIHDLGQRLQNGAYLSSLKRESIQDYHLADAYSVKNLIQIIENQQIV